MISPIITTQNSMPIATIHHNTDAQSVLQGQNATQQVKEEQRQLRESVVQKDESVFYEQHHDAKEEGRNKYVNLYSKKKKKDDKKDESQEQSINRVNFDLKI